MEPNKSIYSQETSKLPKVSLSISADQRRWLAICKADKKREGQGGRQGGSPVRYIAIEY